MGVIVFILSLLLFFRGGGMVMYSFVISLMIWRIEKEYPKKIYGKVVDIKEDVDRKGRTLMRPTVEYLWKGKDKTCCKYINPNIDVKGPVPEADIVFSPDNIHVGDKVTIWYKPDNIYVCSAQNESNTIAYVFIGSRIFFYIIRYFRNVLFV